MLNTGDFKSIQPTLCLGATLNAKQKHLGCKKVREPVAKSSDIKNSVDDHESAT